MARSNAVCIYHVQFGPVDDDMELGLKEEDALNVEALSPEMEATAMIRVTVRGLPSLEPIFPSE
jgi:hypothetical protein